MGQTTNSSGARQSTDTKKKKKQGERISNAIQIGSISEKKIAEKLLASKYDQKLAAERTNKKTGSKKKRSTTDLSSKPKPQRYSHGRQPHAPSTASGRSNHQAQYEIQEIENARPAPPVASHLFGRFFNRGRSNNNNNDTTTTNINKNIANSSADPLAPPSLAAHQNYQQPGAFHVNIRGQGHSDSSDSDDDSTIHRDPDEMEQGAAAHLQFHNQRNVAPPVIEVFLQEDGEDSEDFQQRQPPSSIANAAPMPVRSREDSNNNNKRRSFYSAGCSSRSIIIFSSLIGIFIGFGTLTLMVVLVRKTRTDKNDSEGVKNTSHPSSLPSLAPASSMVPTSSPVANTPNAPITYPLLFDGVDLDSYAFMGLGSIQYGFDQTECFSSPPLEKSSSPVLGFTCPNNAAIALLKVISYDADGNDIEEPPIDCIANNQDQLTCTYREISTVKTAAQTTIFITACGSDTIADTDIEVEATAIESSTCQQDPSSIAQSLSMGSLCDSTPWSSNSVTFGHGTGFERCSEMQATVDPVLELKACGSWDACDTSQSKTTCAVNAPRIFAQMNVNGLLGCQAFFSKSQWGGFDQILTATDQMVDVLSSSFIVTGYAKEILEEFEQ